MATKTQEANADMADWQAYSNKTDAALPIESNRREHFIPLRPEDLVERLATTIGFNETESGLFRRFAQLLLSTFHFQYHKRLRQLKRLYAPFDPDAETAPAPADPKTETVLAEELFKEFSELLERGNFYRVSTEVIKSATRVASKGGLDLDIDFDAFERLEVFARGEGTVRRAIRKYLNVAGKRELDIPVYRRLVVIFRLRRTERLHGYASQSHIHLKIFKDVPKPDLEMLLPGARFRMSLSDRGKILLPTLSGVVMTLFKLVQGALTVAVAGAYGLLAFLGLAGGTIGYGVKSYMGYLQTQRRYQLTLTQSLYFLNLDNNVGVLCRLLDEAEEQEFREALLAYAFLLKGGDEYGGDLNEMDKRIEVWIKAQLQVDVDFEEADAVDKLERLKLIEMREGGGLRAVDLTTALERLDFAWDNVFQYNQKIVLR